MAEDCFLSAAHMLAADGGSTMFLGDDLIPYLVLALGGALLVGNLAAMVRPRRVGDGGAPVRAPARRAVPLALVGLVAAIWALATLLAG
ncbi:hypothetical protein [Candidatus Poriferisodalis sp.]|uniref:hypothetical protein n=1 Tax=Candidatus Poriferisodalis sp. TaxID=3101277 RepID=UPI003B01D1DC